MKLIVETNDALGGTRYDIHEVVIVRSQHIEPLAGKDRSLIDRQIPGTTEAGAAKSYLRPGFNSPGLSSIRIDYREVADTRHVKAPYYSRITANRDIPLLAEEGRLRH